MHRIESKTHLGRADVTAVRGLLDAATAADAHAALDEHAWLDLVQGGREGFASLVAWEDGHDHPVGYAQVARGASSWALEFVVDPHHRVPGNTIGLDLVQQAARVIASEGGGHVHMWVNQPRPEHHHIAAAIGLAPGHVLYQMRRPLPVDEAVRHDGTAGAITAIVTRPFRVGTDEDAWLEVNNRAFHWHPEQGGWDRATLEQREGESWFDPAGFLLHDDAEGHLDGFCWTKIHKDTDPPLGEIYVIAVDPSRRDRTPGLGRQLVLAGLDYLHGRGLSVGMLYVDADNTPAVKLYIDLGFVINHLDQAYVGDIPPRTLMPGPYDLDRAGLAALLADQPPYRVDQVWRGLHDQGRRPSEMTNLPRPVRDRLDAALPPALQLVTESVSQGGQTVKWLWALSDGVQVETVLMRYPDRATVCVSSQAGCAMGCSFCATGQAGFTRQLSAGEIVEQVVAARRTAAPSRVSNVVFMGMGEPLANYDRVWAAIVRMHDDLGLSARHLTVSTVGVVPGIRRLAGASLPVNLAVSLHAANDHLRDSLVPLNRRYPLAMLMGACRQYLTAKGRRLSFEWALIAGVNDRPGDAKELGELARPLGAHVNLIPLNPTPGYPVRGTSAAGVRGFRDELLAGGVNATVRRNRGTDIDAACGQLAARTAGVTAAP